MLWLRDLSPPVLVTDPSVWYNAWQVERIRANGGLNQVVRVQRPDPTGRSVFQTTRILAHQIDALSGVD